MRKVAATLLFLFAASIAVQADDKKIPKIREMVRDALTLGQASIRTDVHPKDAQIYVDGNLAGTVKDYNGGKERLYVLPGEHNIEFRAPGYDTYTTHVKLIPDQDLRLRARMVKAPR